MLSTTTSKAYRPIKGDALLHLGNTKLRDVSTNNRSSRSTHLWQAISSKPWHATTAAVFYIKSARCCANNFSIKAYFKVDSRKYTG